MSTTISSTASVLNSLIETCKDGQYGFGSAAENVKSADFKALFIELSVQRQQFASELQSLLRLLGEEAERSGTVAGSLHRGWLDINAALTGGDQHAILAECERGEDFAVAAYRDALEQEALPPKARKILQQQFIGVQAAHDRVRELRDRFAQQN